MSKSRSYRPSNTNSAHRGSSRLRLPSRAAWALGVCSLLVTGSVLGVATPSLGDPTPPPPDPLAQLLAPVLSLLAPPQNPTATPTPSTPPPATAAPVSSQVADAVVSSVPVYGGPGGGAMLTTIPGTNILGQPEAFLVLEQVPGWLRVELPIRPNGSTGWIQASSVTTRADPYYIRVHQSRFTLDLYRDGNLQRTFPVAVGTPSTPTPNGDFFVWASQSWNMAPYAGGIFALSAFSPVLTNWPGGGRTGVHGWRDTSVLGSRASNGCVRMAGADFNVLLDSVPLGTPVQIQP
ncbi:MAG: hypothetical protein NVSMB32_17640 [Actinomycetota bacterium]